MADSIYEALACALNQLPNRFPRTESNVETLLLQKIFSPDDAAFCSRLSGTMEPVDAIAARLEMSVKETRRKLMEMARRELVWFDKKDGKPRFRLAPFVVGIYEGHLERMDHEFSHLFEQYLLEGGMKGLMESGPALHRVVPTRGDAKSEWILPYDDVLAFLDGAQSFRVDACVCRKQRKQVGHGCDFPPGMCLSFSSRKGKPGENSITREEAVAILDKAEKIGLVHTVSNIEEGVGYICNCCGCCCTILRGVNEWGIEKSVAHANYFAVADRQACSGCGLCVERCQVNAIALDKYQQAVVDRERCIGCGVCVAPCPTDAIELKRKPDSEITPPPADFAAWEIEREKGRLS